MSISKLIDPRTASPESISYRISNLIDDFYAELPDKDLGVDIWDIVSAISTRFHFKRTTIVVTISSLISYGYYYMLPMPGRGGKIHFKMYTQACMRKSRTNLADTLRASLPEWFEGE